MKTCPVCGSRSFSDMDVCYGCLYHFNVVTYGGGLMDSDGAINVGETIETAAEKLVSATVENTIENTTNTTEEAVAKATEKIPEKATEKAAEKIPEKATGETASVSPAKVLSDVALVPFLQKQGNSQVYKIRFSLSDEERKSSQAFVGVLTFSRESFDMF